MGKVLDIAIDPDIKLSEEAIEDMPDDLKQHLLATMTIACERYKCNWRELIWSIKFYNGQPVINVKKRKSRRKVETLTERN